MEGNADVRTRSARTVRRMVRNRDVPRVGGKNASLGEMVQQLAPRGIRVPEGFATTADAYREFVNVNGIDQQLAGRMQVLERGEASLHETGEAARRLFLEGQFPPEIANAILNAYRELSARSGGGQASVAVRSSATAEDLPDASFAGQQETFLNVRGERELMEACRRCYASLFTDRAIAYREAKGFNHMEVALSIGVQRMVRSDLAGSGVMFSIDTESGFPRAAVISAAWGLGETVVQGAVDPDKYVVFKPLLADARLCPIVEKTRGAKARKMVYAVGGSARTLTVQTTRKERDSFVLSEDEILQLGRWAATVEAHYGRAMDMEWAKDGETDELYLVQARPETVVSTRRAGVIKAYKLKARGRSILVGSAIGEAIAAGEALVIRSVDDIGRFRDGAILVTEMTDPDWVPIMKKAAGIITDHGGTTSHAAIVSRELGVPAIVGTGHGTRTLRDGQELTISCAEGEQGVVYEGILPYEVEEVNLDAIPQTRTQMMVNIASPAAAFRWWRLPAKGVGLARPAPTTAIFAAKSVPAACHGYPRNLCESGQFVVAKLRLRRIDGVHCLAFHRLETVMPRGAWPASCRRRQAQSPRLRGHRARTGSRTTRTRAGGPCPRSRAHGRDRSSTSVRPGVQTPR